MPSLKETIPLGQMTRMHPDGREEYDYTHALSPEHQAQGLKLLVRTNAKPKSVQVELRHGNHSLGVLNGNWEVHKAMGVGFRPHSVQLDEERRGERLSLPMYEAAMAHLAHKLGSNYMYNPDSRSSSATRVYQSLSRKYGWGFKPEANVGGRQYPTFDDWMESPNTDFDGKYKGLPRSKAIIYKAERYNPDGFFEEVEKAPVNEGILAAEENYHGGVADLGDSMAAHHIQGMSGFGDYNAHLQNAASKHLGWNFTAWRNMSKEQYEAWKNGDDIGPVSVTLDQNLAHNWSKLAAVKGDRMVVPLSVQPSHIVMRGRPEERELVVDANQIELPSSELGKSEGDFHPHASSVVVENARGEILWGKRRADGKWTLPGGHLEEGEHPEEAAKRELFEEAGLHAHSIHMLGVMGGQMPVYVFRAFAYGQPHSGFDPDHEVAEWVWVDCFHGVPSDIMNNLAHPDNIALKLYGLQ